MEENVLEEWKQIRVTLEYLKKKAVLWLNKIMQHEQKYIF